MVSPLHSICFVLIPGGVGFFRACLGGCRALSLLRYFVQVRARTVWLIEATRREHGRGGCEMVKRMVVDGAESDRTGRGRDGGGMASDCPAGVTEPEGEEKRPSESYEAGWVGTCTEEAAIISRV